MKFRRTRLTFRNYWPVALLAVAAVGVIAWRLM